MVIDPSRMAHDAKAIRQVLSRMEEMREKQAPVFLVDSLEYAVKGGRISSWRSTIVSLLNIRPIMELEDGLIVETTKVRTHKTALDYIVDLVYQQTGSQPCRLAYIHAGALERVPDLQSRAAEKLNISEEIVTDMAVSVAINLGPGALGIVAVPA